jgi:hypothetical protein
VPPLAALISGIVASKRTPLPHLAPQVPDGTKPDSRVKRFARGGDHPTLTEEVSCFPSATLLLAQLAIQTLGLMLDSSVVGHGCVALMIHVVYKGRALLLAWVGRQGKKGPFPEALPRALVEQVHGWITPGAEVGVLGDGAFDGIGLQHMLHEVGWSSVCRTGSHGTASWASRTLRLATVGWGIKPGTLVAFPEAAMTREAYGPILLLGWWAKGYQEPLYLVSNMNTAAEACRLYAQRFRIEPFFSDQKRRGFPLHKSPMKDHRRLARLLIAAC